MNYSTECLEHMTLFQHTLAKIGMGYDKKVLDAIINDLANSIKFVLPPPNLMNVKVTGPALRLLKLPYPICAFEYSCPLARETPIKGLNAINTTKSSKRIALAYDCSKNVGPVTMLKASGRLNKDATGILVISLYFIDDAGLWSPSFGAGYIDEEVATEDGDILIDNNIIMTKMNVFSIFEQCVHGIYGRMSPEQERMALLNDVADEVATATRACLMLNTKNLKIVKVTDSPEKLNKKRSKKNKPPFFEYHTIDIFFSNTGRRTDRKKINYGLLKNHFDNLYLNKKWGTVMGHFKVRSTGIFWWSEHGRGNKNTGIIEKEYRLKPDL